GAALTIAMAQLPSLFGVSGGGHNFFERVVHFAGQIGQTHYLVLALGAVVIFLLVLGERALPGKPVALGVVALSIIAASALGLPARAALALSFSPSSSLRPPALGAQTPAAPPPALPPRRAPPLRLRDVEGIMPLALGCLLLAYIESVSAARAFAAKHGYALEPR